VKLSRPSWLWIVGGGAKWVVVAGWIGLVAALAPLSLDLTHRTNDEIELPGSSESALVDRVRRDEFPDGATELAVLVYRRAGGLTNADRAEIVRGSQQAARLPDVTQPAAPFGPHAFPGQVSKQGDVAFTVVPIAKGDVFRPSSTIDALRGLRPNDGSLEFHVTGSPALLADFTTAVKKADVKLLLATAALVLLLLLAVYRSPVLAAIPLLVVGLAYVVATGIIDLLSQAGLQVSATSTSLLLVLMFGAGTDYCLLVVSRQRSALRSTEDVGVATGAATSQSMPALVASAATVIFGLLAVLASSLVFNQALGPVNAIGIAVVLAACLTLLPALLAICGRTVFWPRTRSVAASQTAEAPSAFWTRVADGVQRRPAVLLAALVLVLGFGAAAGFAALRIHVDWLKQFSSPTDGTQGFELLRSRFPEGSLATTTILVRRAEGAIRPSDVRLAERRLESVPAVAAVLDTGRRSRDGRTADLQLAFSDDPWGDTALDGIPAVRQALHSLGNDLTGYAGEGTARQYDYRSAAGADFKLLAPLILAVVFVMLVILLRALVIPIFLLATVALSYFASFGFTVLLFRALGQPSVDAELPLIVFIFLVVLGSDYNIFLMSAVRERAGLVGTREAFRQAVVSTGPVITSAGVILAATFAVLAVLPVWELIEIGVAVSLGILIDTFLVRTILVPAGGWLLDDRGWWPSRRPSPGRLPAVIPGPVER